MATAGSVRRPPTRTCVACRTSRPKRELLRVVRTPDRRVVADPTGRLNGRGAYVCRSGDCIPNAIARGSLSRALEIPVPAALQEELAARAADMNDDRGGPSGQE